MIILLLTFFTVNNLQIQKGLEGIHLKSIYDFWCPTYKIERKDDKILISCLGSKALTMNIYIF